MEDERTALWANYQSATDNLHAHYRTANTPTNFYRGIGDGTHFPGFDSNCADCKPLGAAWDAALDAIDAWEIRNNA